MQGFYQKHTALCKLLLRIVILAAVVWAILTFILGFHYIRGNYMYPAVRDGDLCITYKLEQNIQNDIVEYVSPEGKKKLGRLIGLPGDVIDITEAGIMTINGYQPSEEIFYPTSIENAKTKFPYTVPDDSYFILNDFRSDIEDSRIYEAIPKGSIKGKIIFVIRRRGF